MRTNVVDLDSRFKEIDDHYKRIDHMEGAPHIKPAVKATPEGLEKELWVKANLLTEGLRFDESALEGICSVYKEQSRWLFDWNMGEHRYYLPEEILLPMDTTCQVRENKNSDWLCTVEDGVLMLKKDNNFVIEARHIPRPKYYDQEASEGVIMRRIAPKRGQDCLVLNYAPFCMYWTNNKGCSFCNIVPNMKWTKDDLQVSKRSYDQIKNTAKAAFEEGAVRHILLTGGYLRKSERDGKSVDLEDEMIMNVINAMQEGIGRQDIPVNVIRTVPKDEDFRSLEKYKKLGAYSVCFNLEIWDPILFSKYCAGKDTEQGRNHWLRGLEVATEIYGPGKVSTHFVTGFMEPIDSLLEGVEWCAERGIGVIPLVWSPVIGTQYESFRPPVAEWFISMVKKVADIRLKYNVDAFNPAGLPNDDHICGMPSLISDELFLRKVQREHKN